MKSFREFQTFLTIGRALIAAGAAFAVSACSNGADSSVSPSGASAPQGASRSADRPRGPRFDAAQCPASVVYVVSGYSAAVEAYDSTQLKAGPCGSITGLQSAQGLSVDASGNLWVADAGTHGVYEFAPGASGPVRTLSDPNGVPSDVAIDGASGTVYVVDYQNSVNANTLVEVYAGGSTTPTGTLSDPSARNGGYDALDSAGNLYVTFMTQANTAQVDRWIGGTGNPQNLGLQLVSAGGIATTGSGALAICDPFAFRCGLFNPGSTKMSNVFGHMGRRGGSAGPDKPPLLHPNTVALNRRERIAYVVSNVLTTWKYPPPAGEPNHLPLQQIKLPDVGGNGIAVSPASRPGAPY